MDGLRRKGNGAIACIIVSVLFLISMITAVCLTRAVADKFVTYYTGYSLKECRSVFKGLTDKSSKKIEASFDNRYDAEKDLDDFYDNIKATLFLKDSFEFNTDTIYDIVFAEDSGADMQAKSLYNQATLAQYGLKESDIIPLESEDIDEETGEVGNDDNAVVKLLYEVLKNIDKDALYSAGEDDFNLEVTDRQIAAFVNDFIFKILSDPDSSVMADVKAPLAEYGISLENSFSLHQISFYSEDVNIDNVTENVIKLKASVSLNLRSIAKDAVNHFFADTKVPFFFKGMINIVMAQIPKAVYATADIGVSKDVGLNLYINRMDDNKMNILYGIISNLSGRDFKAEMDSAFSNAASSLYETINNTVTDIGSFLSAEHTISVPVFDMALDATINKTLAEKGIEAVRMPQIVKIMASEMPEVSEKFDFRNWYHSFVGDSEEDWVYALEKDWKQEADGSWTYVGDKQSQGVVLDKNNVVEFRDEFINALKKGYGLREDLDFDEVIETLVGEENGSDSDRNVTDEIVDMFDAEKLREILKSENPATVSITDRMIAAIVDDQLERLLEDNVFADALELVYVSLTKKQMTKSEHNYLEIGISIDLHTLILDALNGESDEFIDLIVELLPERIMLRLTDIDITLNPEDNQYSKMKIGFNDLDDDTMNVFLGLMQGMADIGEEEFEKIEVNVRQIIENMADVLPITLAESKIIVPEIYETLAHILNKQLEDDNISVSDLEDSLHLIFEDFEFVPFDKETGDEALQNTIEKYYPIKEGGVDTLKQLLKDSGDIEISRIVDSEGLRDFILGYGKDNYESSEIEKYLDGKKLLLNGENILAFVSDILEESMSDFAEASPKISSLKLDKRGGRDFVTLTMCVSLRGFIGNENDAVMNLLKDVIPENTLLEITVDVTEGLDDSQRAETVININGKSGDDVITIIGKFDKSGKLSQIKSDISRAAVDAFDKIRNNIAIEFVASSSETLLRLPDVLDLACMQLTKDGKNFDSAEASGRVNLFLTLNIMLNSRLDDGDFIEIPDEAKTVEKLKEAYCLDKAVSENFNDLTDEISGKEDVIELINTDKIFFRDPVDVEITAQELGGIFKSNMPEESDFGTLKAIRIIENEGRDGYDMVVTIECNIQSVFENVGEIYELLPTKNFYVEAFIDLNNDYATEFEINGYSGKELEPLYTIISEMSTENASDIIESKGEDVRKAVGDAFDKLDKNIGYEVAENAVILPDIFGFLKKNVRTLADSDCNVNQIREAIQGLYSVQEKPEGYAGSVYNYDYDEIVTNPVSTTQSQLEKQLEEFTSGLLTGGPDELVISDKDLGAYVNEKVDQLVVAQFKILPEGLESVEEYKGDTDFARQTVVILTVKMDFQKVGLNVETAGNAKNLLPDNLLVSFALTPQENGKLQYKAFRINNMSSAAQDVLLKLANIDNKTAHDNLQQQATNCLGVVNGLIDTVSLAANVTYERGEASGVLKIKAKRMI